jgi:hypothetical protein
MSTEEPNPAEDEVKRLEEQVKSDRKLIERAADALAEIDRGPGLIDRHTEVLAALRFRLEGKERAKLEDLLTAAGDIGKKDLGAALSDADKPSTADWPEVEEKKRDWPGL